MIKEQLYLYRNERIRRELENERPEKRIFFFQSDDRDIIDYIFSHVILKSESLKKRMKLTECKAATFDELKKGQYMQCPGWKHDGLKITLVHGETKARLFYEKDFNIFKETEREGILKAFLDRSPDFADAYLFLSAQDPCIPDSMRDQVKIIQLSYAKADEIEELLMLLQFAQKALHPDCRFDERDARKLARLLRGLRMEELESFFYQNRDRLFNADFLKEGAKAEIHKLKAESNKTAKGFTWQEVDSDPGAVGTGNFNYWLNRSLPNLADPERGRKRGTPPPKGVLLTGVPGTGKSLLAKELAWRWGEQQGYPVNYFEFNISQLSSSQYGESERQLQRLLQQVSASEPAILFLDEAEKIIQKPGTNQSVHEVKANQLAMLLHWMQDYKENVVTVWAMNSMESLPRELIRAGRISESFFAFLPSLVDLVQILYIRLEPRAAAGQFDTAFISDIREKCENIRRDAKRKREDERADFHKALMNKLAGSEFGKTLDELAQKEMQKKSASAPKEEQEDDAPRTPFMTGADIEKLIECTMHLLYETEKGDGDDPEYSQDDFVACMKEYLDSPRFTPQGQIGLDNIVSIYREGEKRRLQDISSEAVLPFFESRPGKKPVDQSNYNAYLRETIREKVKAQEEKEARDRRLQEKQEKLLEKNYEIADIQLRQLKEKQSNPEGGADGNHTER